MMFPYPTSCRRKGSHCALVVLLFAVMLTMTGCEGCNSAPKTPAQIQAEEEANRKKLAAEKKKEEPLEIQPLVQLLAVEPPPEIEIESENPQGRGVVPLLVKPGHWTTTVQEMKANYDDFVGESSTTLADQRMRPTPLKDTNFTFRSKRPVALAKGLTKRVEGELFIPEQSPGKQLKATLWNRATGREEPIGQPLLRKMPSYQYFVVVLAKEVSRYGFLKVSDAVRMPWEEEFEEASQPHYRVTLADATKSLPLPSNMLTWSSVAYLVWDEVDPTLLTSEQQLALVDWVHWGGRLVINGPDSLDSLRGSFLDEYLPAENGGPRTLTSNDLRDWSAYWSRRDRGERPPLLEPTKPWSGIALKPKAGATELVGGGELFYERMVGNGTIVVSAIQLAERDFLNWPGYDSFLNGALFRRPRRAFSEGTYGGAQVGWVDYPKQRLDAHFSTALRLFSRDVAMKANEVRVKDATENLYGVQDNFSRVQTDRPGGLGAWDDFNPISAAAREVLAEAAAVRVPGAGFVLSCLALYLLVLVPLNWMVFRTLGRLEWAWIAAPVIALLGTLVIVRQAQLDIGFVRSQTEVALLELQGPYPRGVLSRYTALYSSLSTTYDMVFEEPTTVAVPFPAKDRDGVSRDEAIWDVVFEKHNEARLNGLAVSSASTKMVRSEQMYPLAGSMLLGKSSRGHEQLENRLGYNLRDLAIVRRFFDSTGAEKYESCWIGELREGDTSVIAFSPMMLEEAKSPHADQRREAAGGILGSGGDVEPLMKLAFQFPGEEDPLGKQRTSYRAVGIIDQVLPGSEVVPAASQIVGTTIVVAHLKYGDLAKPLPDVNSRGDVVTVKNASR